MTLTKKNKGYLKKYFTEQIATGNSLDEYSNYLSKANDKAVYVEQRGKLIKAIEGNIVYDSKKDEYYWVLKWYISL